MRLLNVMLGAVERAGNRLPDPVTLFVFFIFLVMLISWVASLFGVSVIHPSNGETIAAVNLFSAENIQRLFVEMPKTFASFPPLGMVLVVMIGIGVADKSGLITAALKTFINSIPPYLLTAALVFAGIMSSLAADAGYVVLIPLGAVLFHSAGRHPIAGLAATFAGVSGGFCANLLLTPIDPLLAGFTEPAAQIVDPSYVVNPAANYYLMIALTPLLVLGAVWVNAKLIEPHLGEYKGDVEEQLEKISNVERKALRITGVVLLALLAIIAYMVVPENGVLRDATDGGYKPFYKSIVSLMMVLFLVLGLVYGFAAKKIKNDKQVVQMMSETMSDLGSYIVLAFVAAHFVVLFKWSNLGIILAVNGAEFLQQIGFVGIPLIISFIIICCFINLFVGSASAKWAIMSPIFVPMLMLLGYSPELAQASFRIGDSITNILTPLMLYFPLVIIFVRKYNKDYGIGTLVSVMMPYSIVFGVLATALLIIWIAFGIPLGPDAPVYFSK